MATTTVNSKQNAVITDKVIGAALFTESVNKPSVLNNLTGEAPKAVENKFSQTGHTAPVVRVSDLTKQAGDEVTMNIVYQLRGAPTMGDRILEGKEEALKFGEFGLKINQGRKAVSGGGKMSQKRTKVDLIKTAKTLLDTYYLRYQDQWGLYHLAGARGDYQDRNTLVPLASDPLFNEYAINPLKAPTYDCHLFGGDGQATSVANLQATDKLTMTAVDNLYLYLKEKEIIQPCTLKGDKDEGNPMFIAYCSERQLMDLKASLETKDWSMLVANAMNRASGWNHPVFKGNDVIMYNNILFKSYGSLPIRFNSGSTVMECANDKDATESGATVGVGSAYAVDRLIVLGAQALANAYGSGFTGTPFGMKEEKRDYDNQTNFALSWIGGMKKIQMRDYQGKLNDFGVVTMDTVVSL